MLTSLVCLTLLTAQGGFDWEISGADGPLNDFSMTANFSSRAVPFEGPVPENRDIKIAAGGQAFARINVEFRVEQYGQSYELWTNTCGNICQGPPPNHASHEECDRFCDRPCENGHKFETQAHEGYSGWGLESLQKPFVEEFAKAAELFQKRGLSVDSNLDWLAHIRDGFISRANEKADSEKFVYEPAHIARDPYLACVAGRFTVFGRNERVVANIMKDLVFQEKQGNEYVTVIEVPMGEDVVIPVSVGSTGVSMTIKESGVNCLCGGQSTSLNEDLPAIGIGTQWRSIPVTNPTKTYSGLLANMEWGNTKVNATGESMTHCNFEITGDRMSQVYLPAGTLLVPDDSSTQVMMVMEDYTSSPIFAGDGFLLNRVRTTCMQMEKDEPTSATKFAIAAPSDGNLRRLANFTAQSSFRGPWDQVRMWIYSDLATYDQIEKKLSPMVSKGTYLAELDRVLDGGMTLDKRKKLTSAITLDMIADDQCGVSGLNRALPVLWKGDSKKLIESAPSLAANWLKESPEQGAELVAQLAYFLGLKPQTTTRASARQILNLVPAEQRKKVVDHGGLDSISVGVFSADMSEVRSTVDLLKTYGSTRHRATLTLGESRLAAN